MPERERKRERGRERIIQTEREIHSGAVGLMVKGQETEGDPPGEQLPQHCNLCFK